MNCYRHFDDANSFRRHFRLNHVIKEFSDKGIPSTPKVSVNQTYVDDVDVSADKNVDNLQLSVSNADSKMLQETSAFIAFMYNNPMIPRFTIQLVVDGIQSLYKNVSNTLRFKFHSVVPHVSDDVNNGLNETLSFQENSMSPFRSEFKRLQIFTSSGTYIPSQEIIICHRANTRVDQGTFSLSTLSCTMQIIPLSLVLQRSIEAVYQETTNYIKYLEANIALSNSTPDIPLAIENVIQGSLWQKKNIHHTSLMTVI